MLHFYYYFWKQEADESRPYVRTYVHLSFLKHIRLSTKEHLTRWNEISFRANGSRSRCNFYCYSSQSCLFAFSMKKLARKKRKKRRKKTAAAAAHEVAYILQRSQPTYLPTNPPMNRHPPSFPHRKASRIPDTCHLRHYPTIPLTHSLLLLLYDARSIDNA